MAVRALFTERSDEPSLELKYLVTPYDSHPRQTLSTFTKQATCTFHLLHHNQEQLA